MGNIPWRRNWQPTRVLLPGESSGQRSLEGYSPRHYKEEDTAEQINNNSNIQIEREKVHLLLFQDDMMHYIENPTVSTKKKENLSELINEFSKVEG